MVGFALTFGQDGFVSFKFLKLQKKHNFDLINFSAGGDAFWLRYLKDLRYLKELRYLKDLWSIVLSCFTFLLARAVKFILINTTMESIFGTIPGPF